MIKVIIKTFLAIVILQLTLQSNEINIDKLSKTAYENNKHLFVWLHRPDCGYCESMKEFTLDNDKIKDFIKKHFIFVHIDVFADTNVRYKNFYGRGKEFAKHIGHAFYPSSIFFDKNANIVFSELGYRDNNAQPNEKRFYTILNYVNSKEYNKIDYEDYTFDKKEEL